LFSEPLQVKRPDVGSPHHIAQSLPALAMALKVAVLDLDPGALRRLGDEQHLHLACPAKHRTRHATEV
jgi:hypothetical protein